MHRLRLSLPARVAGVVAALGLVVLMAAPAGAHEDLLGASPGVDARVAPGSTVVELQFTAIDAAGPGQLVLLDADGQPVRLGEPDVQGAGIVCLRSAPLESGAYTMQYAMTGVDGHPIIGRYDFEVAVGEEPAPTGSCVTDDLEAVPAAQDAEDTSSSGGLWAIFALLGVAGLGAVVLVRRLSNLT